MAVIADDVAPTWGGRSPGDPRRASPWTSLLADEDEVRVGSHDDAMTVRVADAPGPDEIVIVAAVASRGRMHARLGGMTEEETDAAAA